MKLSLFVTSVAILISGTAFAQSPTVVDQSTQQGNDFVNDSWKPSLVRDGAYDKVPHKSVPIPWQTLREADVLWSKRVWREIDVNERQNMPFRYAGDDNSGGGMFIEILISAIKNGKLKAYSASSAQGERFTTALTKDQIMEKLAGSMDSTAVYDPTTNTTKMIITNSQFDVSSVIKYRVKEDVLFDRNLGRKVVRILGIAPIVEVRDPNDPSIIRGQSPMFWIYYPEAREVLAQYEVFNPENDVSRLTWDDFFEGRFFASRIYKVSNPFDDRIGDRYNGIESLYQGNNVAEELFNKEHDMWVY